MGSVFPGSLDSWGDVQDNVDYVEASHINDLRDAIEKIEAKIGTGSYNSDLHDLVVPLLDGYVDGSNRLRFWVYHNTFSATGWSVISTSSGSNVLGAKGSTYYPTGGTTAGVWTMPSHIHTFVIPGNGWSTGSSYSSGILPIARGIESDGMYGSNTSSLRTLSTSGTGTVSNWRPTAYVNILVLKS